MSKYKDDIIRLRKQGKSYREIEDELECSKGTVAYHCKQAGLEDIGKKVEEISDKKKKAIRETYREKTAKETAEIHGVSESTVQKYGENNKKKVGGFKEVKSKPLFESESKNKVSYTHFSGYVGEQKVASEALKRGYIVSKPVVESRYDLLIDNGKEIKRVQVKYSGWEKQSGAYTITLKSECRNNGIKKP